MDHIATVNTYKRNGIEVLSTAPYCGVFVEEQAQYQFPKEHPCHDCPYTLRTNVPSCMFPERKDGGCFWHDIIRRGNEMEE